MDGSVSRDEFIQVLNYFHYYIDGVELDKLLMRLLFILISATKFTYFWFYQKKIISKFQRNTNLESSDSGLRNCGTPFQYSVIKSLTNNNIRCLFSGILKAIICLCDFLQQTLDKVYSLASCFSRLSKLFCSLFSVGLHSSKDISYAEFIKTFGTSSKPTELRPLTAPIQTSTMRNLENEELSHVLRRMIHENPDLFEKVFIILYISQYK